MTKLIEGILKVVYCMKEDNGDMEIKDGKDYIPKNDVVSI